MVLNVSFDIENTIWNGFECFQDGHQIALKSMVMGLFLNSFLLLAFILSDLKMVTSNCLGHKFNWEVSYSFHAQVDITVELPIYIKMCQCEETVYAMASNPGLGVLQGMLVFVVSQLLIN